MYNRFILNRSVDDLDILVRVKNVLKKYGIETIKDLSLHTMRQLLYYKGIGRVALRQIVELLAQYGIVVKEGTSQQAHRWALRKGYIKR